MYLERFIPTFMKTETTPTRTVAEIVAEIHETFFTEVDRLSEDCKALQPLESSMGEQIEKSKALWSLGFTCCKDVVSIQHEHLRLNTIEMSNNRKQVISKAINYFSLKYPNYKFITEESVQKICKKYGLIYGDVHRFVGSVPNKNLNDIMSFKTNEEDDICIMHPPYCCDYSYSLYGSREFQHHDQSRGFYVSRSEANSMINEHKEKYPGVNDEPYFEIVPLEIAAPPSDFNKEGYKLDGSKLVAHYPDPVVLKPVFFESKKYYLIVTAWGPEASDELVVNEKMN